MPLLSDFTPLAALAAMVIFLVNLIREGLGRQWGAFLTMLLGWLAGIFVIWLFAQSDFENAISVGDKTLGQFNFASHVIIGLSVVGVASFGWNILGAIDSSRNTAVPKLAPQLDRDPTPPSN